MEKKPNTTEDSIAEMKYSVVIVVEISEIVPEVFINKDQRAI